ncbi:YqiA/YcfP family alpha/beta fold hydrolase [Lyngbya sp. CCY1209]|uniref:YqiA/YcfP family alpha/beta fold hydrolase n=1 Tax=Lyngbya sp. CCY1209 TaxID=2886103 RepID=UPI002D211258|nr:YqiA/YcfP family alpha/beta fold hydrolase [Lyngbya sp. CCY1209]MEB3884150.1 prolyl oligopeptidase family serine peptidase [Lyngbya sp. CCY1209]
MPSDCFTYLYLHGFASGPKSAKAQYLRDRFSECAIALNIPDLNQGDFLNLTLTRQIRQVEAEFFAPPRRAIAIGSSFGGLTATWLAQRQASIEKLVLLAPAFDFLSHLLPHLGRTQLQQWQNDGTLSVYHYGYGQETPLKYNFIKDLTHYDDGKLGRFIPTLILHGTQDEVIPIQSSRDFARDRPGVELVELEDDHSLGNVLPDIWEQVKRFLEL